MKYGFYNIWFMIYYGIHLWDLFFIFVEKVIMQCDKLTLPSSVQDL